MTTLNNVVLFVLVLIVAFGSVACEFDDNGGGGSPTGPSVTPPSTPTPPATRTRKRIVWQCFGFEWTSVWVSPVANGHDEHWFRIRNECSFRVLVKWASWDSGRVLNNSATLGAYAERRAFWRVPKGRERGGFLRRGNACIYRYDDPGDAPC